MNENGTYLASRAIASRPAGGLAGVMDDVEHGADVLPISCSVPCTRWSRAGITSASPGSQCSPVEHGTYPCLFTLFGHVAAPCAVDYRLETHPRRACGLVCARSKPGRCVRGAVLRVVLGAGIRCGCCRCVRASSECARLYVPVSELARGYGGVVDAAGPEGVRGVETYA